MAEFTKDDMQLLADAQSASMADDAAALAAAQGAEAPAPAPAPAPSPAPAPTPAAPAPAPAPTPAAPAPPAPAPAPAAPAPAPAEEARGNVNAALRASRHAERLHRERAERLTAEVEELKKKVPAAPAPPTLDDKVRTDLESYAPEAVKVLDAQQQALVDANAEITRLRGLTAAPAPAEAFVPDELPDHLQDEVDMVPELAGWQNSPQHAAAWRAAKAADGLLFESGSWKGKPVHERLAEAVKLVKQQNPAFAPAPAVDPAVAAKAVIDALPITTRTPAVGDLRSGESAHTELPDYHLMAKQGMSDEEIMARLPH